DYVAVADYLQDSMRKSLQQSDLMDVFLLSPEGALLSHSTLKDTLQFAGNAFGHPVLSLLKGRGRGIGRESLELDIDGENYFVNVADTGVSGIVAVSQMRREDAFIALRVLLERAALILLIVFSASVIVSLLLASRLAADVRRLKIASEMIA